MVCNVISFNSISKLFHNTKVLYPPSEFKDEKNYLNLIRFEDQEEIINLQSENLEKLQKQLLKIKESINNIVSIDNNQHFVDPGIDETKTEKIDKAKNQSAEISKKTN